MTAVITDPTKSALIQAVAAGLSASPWLALEAVCELSAMLPVYLAQVPDLLTAATGFVAWKTGAGPIPDWYKHSLGQ